MLVKFPGLFHPRKANIKILSENVNYFLCIIIHLAKLIKLQPVTNTPYGVT